MQHDDIHSRSALPSASAAPTSGDAHRANTVEILDGRRVAQVVASFGGRPFDVAHVGQQRDAGRMGKRAVIAGALMILAGGGLFAYETSRDWSSFHAASLTAQEQGVEAPAQPGLGTGGLGLAIALMGLVPAIAGAAALSRPARRSYAIGEAPDADLQTNGAGLPDADRFELVRLDGERVVLRFARSMEGEIRDAGGRRTLHEVIARGEARNEGDRFALVLGDHDSARIRHGQVDFHVRSVAPGAIVAGRGSMDWHVLGHVAGVAAVAAGFMLLSSRMPQDVWSTSEATEQLDSRFVGFMNQPDVAPTPLETIAELDTIEDSGESEPGLRHAGESGTAGKPASKKSDGRLAVRGDATQMPKLARTFDPDAQARNEGILGVMAMSKGSLITSPYGAFDPNGSDDMDIFGSVTGTRIGENHGNFGLGTDGMHRGGGGAEGLIGLSHVGTIGDRHREGDGTSPYDRHNVGFDKRKPKAPEVRVSKGTVDGTLDKDIVRRIVRAHINEVRACYNQGLTRNPHLQGRVVVAFSIMGTGKVASSVVQETSLKDDEVANCIAKAAKRWSFPRPTGGGSVFVSYPFVLNPG